jgi:hypothetical protein
MENGDQPAAQRGPDVTRGELKQQFELFRSDIRERTAELKGVIRACEAEMLKAIYGCAHRIDVGITEPELADMLFRSRLSAVESRVTEIERRINQPPIQTH